MVLVLVMLVNGLPRQPHPSLLNHGTRLASSKPDHLVFTQQLSLLCTHHTAEAEAHPFGCHTPALKRKLPSPPMNNIHPNGGMQRAALHPSQTVTKVGRQTEKQALTTRITVGVADATITIGAANQPMSTTCRQLWEG